MDLYNELTENAKKHNMLYHYTSLEGLKQISKNKSLKLTRLDKVNDPCENSRINSLWNKRIFVSCFTHSMDNSEYFYKYYNPVRITIKVDHSINMVYEDSKCTMPVSIKNYPSITKDMDYRQLNDFEVYDISIADIYYTDDFGKHFLGNGHESNAGLIKLTNGYDTNYVTRNWKTEKETRVRVAIKPKGIGAYLNEKNDICYYALPEHVTALYYPIPGEIVSIDLWDKVSNKEKEVFEKICRRYSV